MGLNKFNIIGWSKRGVTGVDFHFDFVRFIHVSTEKPLGALHQFPSRVLKQKINYIE